MTSSINRGQIESSRNVLSRHRNDDNDNCLVAEMSFESYMLCCNTTSVVGELHVMEDIETMTFHQAHS